MHLNYYKHDGPLVPTYLNTFLMALSKVKLIYKVFKNIGASGPIIHKYKNYSILKSQFVYNSHLFHVNKLRVIIKIVHWVLY